MGTDVYGNHIEGLMTPALNAASPTLHDTNELTNWCKAFLVGGAGDLVVVTSGGDTVTLTGLLAGVVYPIQCKIMKSTGSTATSIVALY